MKSSVYIISYGGLLMALMPMMAIIFLTWKWSLRPSRILYATARMLLQLSSIGFVLTFIFQGQRLWPLIAVLVVMITVASWIALQSMEEKNTDIVIKVFFSLALVGLAMLAFIIFGIIRPSPWYLPTYVIPLAGMIFSNAMNTLSIAAERFFKESADGMPYERARNIAWKTALIPLTNTFFAVGLVSLPGMMTGQILAGIDPLVAVRYQILVMSCLYASSGGSSALFLFLMKKRSVRIAYSVD